MLADSDVPCSLSEDAAMALETLIVVTSFHMSPKNLAALKVGHSHF